MFSKNLKYLRTSFGFEQLEFAKMLGRKSASTISEWESGKYTPKIGVLNHIANIFKVDIDDLMNRDLTLPVTTLHTTETHLSPTVQTIVDISVKLDLQRQKNILNYAKQQQKEQQTNHLEVFAAHMDLEKQKELTPEDIAQATHTIDDLIQRARKKAGK